MVKRTLVGNPEDPKIQDIRRKLCDTVSYTDTPLSKAEMLSAALIKERIKREQITAMLVPQMKDLNLGQKYDLFCYDKNSPEHL